MLDLELLHRWHHRVLRWTLPALLLASALTIFAPRPATAHPHVWIDARATLVFDAQRRLVGVDLVWLMDEFFSAMVADGVSRQDDTDAAWKAIAEEHRRNLGDFRWFSTLKVGDKRLDWDRAENARYVLQDDDRLRFTLSLRLAEPVVIDAAPATLALYDPSFYVAVQLAETDPVALSDDAKGCTAKVGEPPALDGVALSDAEVAEGGEEVGASYAQTITLACKAMG